MTTAHICVHPLLPKTGTLIGKSKASNQVAGASASLDNTPGRGHLLQDQFPDPSNASACLQSGAKDDGKWLLPLKTMPPYSSVLLCKAEEHFSSYFPLALLKLEMFGCRWWGGALNTLEFIFAKSKSQLLPSRCLASHAPFWDLEVD